MVQNDDPVVHEGHLRGVFRGFRNRNTVFEFVGGQKWRQAEYHYQYHYAYWPSARIVARQGENHIEVDGVSGSVRVRRVR